MSEHGEADRIQDAELEGLTNISRRCCVSLFLPTHVAGRETRQNVIRFRNLLSEAHARVRSRGLTSAEANKLLAPAEALIGDEEFWRHQSQSLAVFLADDYFARFRLPLDLSEQLYVMNYFHVRPLIEARWLDAACFVLALSQQEVRLFRRSVERFEEIEEVPLPSGIIEILQYVETDRQLQTAYHGDSHGGMSPATTFHGHGGVGSGDIERKVRILEFCRLVDRELTAFLRGSTAPLIVACVEYLFPLFREACSYPHLVNTPIRGNPSDLSREELSRQAGQLLDEIHQQAVEQACDVYNDRAGSDLASTDPVLIGQAARHGYVDKVFLSKQAHIWASIKTEDEFLAIDLKDESTDEELLDFIARETFRNGGEVYFVEPSQQPSRSPVSATFRGPVTAQYFGLAPMRPAEGLSPLKNF